LKTELDLNPDSNLDPDQKLITDPDPNLQIISNPFGSRSTTLDFIENFPFMRICGMKFNIYRKYPELNLTFA
jgi:hypothetical protein